MRVSRGKCKMESDFLNFEIPKFQNSKKCRAVCVQKGREVFLEFSNPKIPKFKKYRAARPAAVKEILPGEELFSCVPDRLRHAHGGGAAAAQLAAEDPPPLIYEKGCAKATLSLLLCDFPNFRVLKFRNSKIAARALFNPASQDRCSGRCPTGS